MTCSTCRKRRVITEKALYRSFRFPQYGLYILFFDPLPCFSPLPFALQALADEFNSAKSGSEALFHTKVKPFNFLHPNCIFAASPEFVTLENLDTVAVAGFPAKYPVSAKHQVRTECQTYIVLYCMSDPQVTCL